MLTTPLYRTVPKRAMKAGGRENGLATTYGRASCAGRIYYPPISISMDDLDPRMPGALRLVRKWCPDLSEEELAEAAQNFLAYMNVVRRIYERLIIEGHDVGKMLEERKICNTWTHAVEPRNR